MHTQGSARSVLTDFLLLHMPSESPRHSKQTCDLFSQPTAYKDYCFHGSLDTFLPFFIVSAAVGMVVQHFQNDFEFKSSNDRGEKEKEGPPPIVSAREFPEYTEEWQPSLPSQSAIRQQQTRGGVEFDKERAAAELGTVLAVCFPGFG